MAIQISKQDEQILNEVTNPENKDFDVQAYSNNRKAELRNLPEVQNLNSLIVLDDTNTILRFGQEASVGIAKVSENLLNTVKLNRNEDNSKLLNTLAKVMNEFDIKDFEEGKEPGFLKKLFKKASNSIEDIFKKYDTMGGEVAKIEMELRKYEKEVEDSNRVLKSLLVENMNFYNELQKYIVAGELAIEEMDNIVIPQAQEQANASGDQLDLITLQTYQEARDMIEQRVYDLQVAETISLQTIPMLRAMQSNNFALVRKINSAFVVTLPVFKQSLTQAVIVKKQKLQADSMKALDDKTNEMLKKNAQNIVNTSTALTRMNASPSINIETLESTYNTIKAGIEETLRIEEECRQKRANDRVKLEELNQKMLTTNKM